MNPEMMGPRAEAAGRLSDLLGDHHDLAVLEARLVEVEIGPGTDMEAFRALLARRKAELAEEAFALGRLVFAERRKALVKRWRGYWAAWQEGKDAPERLLVAG
jgi:hypothetical protein